MLQLFLKSHLAFLLIPLLTLALEPNNPSSFCDRFLGDAEKAQCLEKTAPSAGLDWYAASACSLLEDDHGFMSCLDEIKGATYNPEALELCGKGLDITDSARRSCLRKIKNKDYTRAQIKSCAENGTAVEECLNRQGSSRAPASKPQKSGFQTVEIQRDR